MSNIKNWHSTATDNSTLADGGWPEGMLPSKVNDQARDNMGAIRTWYEDAEWIDYDWTPSYVTTSTFTLVGDRTTQFHVGRRFRARDGASTLYGSITSATYTAGGGGTSGIYCALDTGQFSASLSGVAVGILSAVNTSLPPVSTATHALTTSYLDMLEMTSTAGNNGANCTAALSIGATTAGDHFWISGYVTGHASGTSCNSITISAGNMVGVFVNGSPILKWTDNWGAATSAMYRVVDGIFRVTTGDANSVFSASCSVSGTVNLGCFCMKRV